MGVYLICDLTHIVGVGVATVAAPKLRELKIMENLNINNAELLDPKDAEIEALKEQLANARRRADFQADQLDQFGDVIMGVIGDKVEALAESVADKMVDDRIVETVTDCFDIYDHQSEIETMIDERLAERLGEEMTSDESREAIESQVREVLASATVSLDI